MQRVDDMGWFLPCWKPRLDMKDGELEKPLRNLLQHHCRYKSFHEFLERDASAGEGQSLMDSPACSCWWHPQINGPCAAITSGWGPQLNVSSCPPAAVAMYMAVYKALPTVSFKTNMQIPTYTAVWFTTRRSVIPGESYLEAFPFIFMAVPR